MTNPYKDILKKVDEMSKPMIKARRKFMGKKNWYNHEPSPTQAFDAGWNAAMSHIKRHLEL